MPKMPSGNPPGRPKKPSPLKLLHGDFKINPQRQNTREPIPATLTVDPPREMTKPARELWDRLVPDMVRTRTVTRWDESAMVEVCEAVVMMRVSRLRALREEQGQAIPPGVVPGVYVWRNSVAVFNSLASQVGMTPAARSRLAVSAERQDDSDDLISGTGVGGRSTLK